jgi:hypothetical protein
MYNFLILFCIFSTMAHGANITVNQVNTSQVYGAYTNGSEALSGNTVTVVDGGSASQGVYGAYTISTGNLTNNSVIINGGKLTGSNSFIAGAYTGVANQGATVAGNAVIINGGSLIGTNMMIYGGKGTTTAEVINNYVRITGGTINVSAIYGGENVNGAGDVNENTVTISGGDIKTSDGIYGGRNTKDGTTGGETMYNTVTVTNGTITGKIYGGRTNGGNADSNEVEISGGFVTGNIYGGFTESGLYSADWNSVSISGGTVVGSIYGSQSVDNSSYNSVDISGGTVNGGIYGGYSTSNNANANSITIDRGVVNGNFYGGYAAAGLAQQNFVDINGGTVTGNVYGGWSTNGNNANNVYVDGGTVNGSVHGGYADSGNATYNMARSSGGTVNGDLYGGYADSGDATNNTAWINGGTVNGDVYGGYANSGSTTNNTVRLSGGTVTGTVYGGNSSTTTGNKLTASSGETSVGNIENFDSVDSISGATIRVTGDNNVTFDNVTNNGWITFVNNKAGGTIYNDHKVEGTYSGSGNIGLDVRFRDDAGVNDADSIIFDHTPAGTVGLYFKASPGSIANPYDPQTKIAELTDNGTLNFTTVEQGFGIYSYEFIQSGNKLLIGLHDRHVEETTKPYSDSAAGGMASLAAGFDTFMRGSLRRIVSDANGKGWEVFTSVSASSEIIDVGNDVDIESYATTISLAYNEDGSPVTVGMYGELSNSTSTSQNRVKTDIDTFDVKAKAGFNNVSFGGFVGYTQHPYELHGAHIESSLRIGYSDMDFSTHSINPSKFDSREPFFGVSLGGGYVFTTAHTALDLYGYGIYFHRGAINTTDNLEHRIRFEEADAYNFVAGGRMNFTGMESVRPYIGMYANYERMNPVVYVDGYIADKSEVHGLSAMFELGLNASNRDNTFIADLMLTGTTGKRTGVGILAEVKYMF